MYIMQLIRTMYNLEANHTTWGNEASRQMHMDMERNRLKRKKHREPSSILLPIISRLINDPGYKYNREQTEEQNIFFVYDCLKQCTRYQSVDHLMTGVYVGLIDSKKLNLEDSLNLLRKDLD